MPSVKPGPGGPVHYEQTVGGAARGEGAPAEPSPPPLPLTRAAEGFVSVNVPLLGPFDFSNLPFANEIVAVLNDLTWLSPARARVAASAPAPLETAKEAIPRLGRPRAEQEVGAPRARTRDETPRDSRAFSHFILIGGSILSRQSVLCCGWHPIYTVQPPYQMVAFAPR